MTEFWPHEEWPDCSPIIPGKSLWRRAFCLLTGGHAWKDWYWGPFAGIDNYLTPEGAFMEKVEHGKK